MKNLNELLPIGEKNGQKAVNARDLHSFLQVGKDFSTWIKNRIDKYDFIEGKDFQTLYLDYQGNLLNIRLPQNGDSENQQVSKIEYALSISMAKELSMIENNERGKQARKYFIACEENKHELSRKDLALMVLQAEEEKERLALEVQKKEEDSEIIRAIRSTKMGGRELLALLDNIQAGNVTFLTAVNNASEEAETEEAIEKDA